MVKLLGNQHFSQMKKASEIEPPAPKAEAASSTSEAESEVPF